jgi:hypothetical protein
MSWLQAGISDQSVHTVVSPSEVLLELEFHISCHIDIDIDIPVPNGTVIGLALRDIPETIATTHWAVRKERGC